MDNYYQKSLQLLDKIAKEYKKTSVRPTLLFHVCCGPCSLYPLEKLCDVFDITVFYSNSNIYPEDEYLKRLDQLELIINDLNLRKEKNIKLIIQKYDHEEYMNDLRPFFNLKEDSLRCQLCYRKRMSEAYDYAESNCYSFFTTSLTSSRQKSSTLINKIGEELEKNHAKTKYLYSDFKKKGRAEKGYSIAKEKNLYLQTYCGCEYSFEE